MDAAVPQCIAQLHAAEIFNKQNQKEFKYIYGTVTTGYNWQIVRYHNLEAIVDTNIYYLNELPQLLGILQHIVDIYK